MPRAPSRTGCTAWLAIFAVAGLVVCFLVQARFFLSANSQTYDEAVHIAAGHRYLTLGDFQFNREHPPLTKLLSAFPAYVLFALPNETSLAARDQWSAGSKYLYESGEPANRLLTAGRLSSIFLGASTIIIVARWSWRLWGPGGAVFSAALLAFDPNVLAHSCLATTDMGATFFFCLTLYQSWSHACHPRWSSWLITGAAMGAALASKFSTVVLLPAMGIISLAYPLMTGRTLLPVRQFSEPLGGRQHIVVQSLAYYGGLLIAAELTLWACYLCGDVTIWLDGVADQWWHQQQGHPAFLLGSYSDSGWPYYFLAAVIAKAPLGTLLALVLLTMNLRDRSHWQRETALVLAVPLLLFTIAACCARTNIGLRHVLPVYVLMFVALGSLARLTCRRAFQQGGILCAILAVSTAAESLSVAPHQLSFFNKAVGGPPAGHRYLSDSNLDWGQDLEGLSAWLRQRGNPVIYLSYFGTAPPSYFGIRYQPLPGFGNSPPVKSFEVPLDAKQELLAISEVNLQGVYFENHELYAWLRQRTPIAQIGYSIMIYDITHDVDAHLRLARLYEAGSLRRLADREILRTSAP
jgi:4-amino-4-deoxy-L-arabinose transferase-like glycosyltransferase